MKCKFQCFYTYLSDKVFQTMDLTAPGPSTSCSCEGQDSQINSITPTTSNSEANTVAKDRSRGRINLFGLCREKQSAATASKKGKKSQSSGAGGVVGLSIIKRSPRLFKYLCLRREPKTSLQDMQSCCQCTCYRRTNDSTSGSRMFSSNEENRSCSQRVLSRNNSQAHVTESAENTDGQEEIAIWQEVVIEPATGLRGIYGTAPATSSIPSIFVSEEILRSQQQHEDCEEAARLARAREIERGVDAPANFRPLRRVQLVSPAPNAAAASASGPTASSSREASAEDHSEWAPARRLQLVCPSDLSLDSLRALFRHHVTLRSCPLDSITGCHTQVDYIHCLVPDLLTITNCSFYWGKMDRYEAESLLEGKPEGTFLIRDSAQEEFLFSVSFRKYGRSLHARIEQWNHKFSFDCHDPGVYTSDTVCGLIEHYKDPSSCMFFEPILTWPLHRKFTFSLQHLARAVIVSRLTYDDINTLQLPKSLKNYLKEYHYRQKVRVERFDDDVQWLELFPNLCSGLNNLSKIA
nr:unnamed protein product [Callosobruchus chinensis]